MEMKQWSDWLCGGFDFQQGVTNMKYLAALFSLWALAYPLELPAQTAKPTNLAELAVYNGADREQLLAAGAKKEGKVVWYTALAGGSYRDLARAFETKYAVPVEAYRGASRDLIAKVLAETQAKKYLIDVAEISPKYPYPFGEAIKTALEMMADQFPQAGSVDAQEVVDLTYVKQIEAGR